LTADGDVPELGAVIKQPELADTLEAMANQGAKGFYEGRVAADLVAGVRAGGGIWTLEDLADYRVIERKPLVGEYHGARIVSASPPSSGGVPCWTPSISCRVSTCTRSIPPRASI
jgi:gamma-glutamyltranspeptidase/glutathione hydrolase